MIRRDLGWRSQSYFMLLGPRLCLSSGYLSLSTFQNRPSHQHTPRYWSQRKSNRWGGTEWSLSHLLLGGGEGLQHHPPHIASGERDRNPLHQLLASTLLHGPRICEETKPPVICRTEVKASESSMKQAKLLIRWQKSLARKLAGGNQNRYVKITAQSSSNWLKSSCCPK